MAQARANDPFIGREILNGEFRILQKIGSGGMGSVYKAEQPEMNRMVAIKILHPKLTNRQDLASRFRREARAMAQLSHPNTVKVFTYGELDDGSLYIVMEFLEGRNLNRAVKRDGPLPVEQAPSRSSFKSAALFKKRTLPGSFIATSSPRTSFSASRWAWMITRRSWTSASRR